MTEILNMIFVISLVAQMLQPFGRTRSQVTQQSLQLLPLADYSLSATLSQSRTEPHRRGDSGELPLIEKQSQEKMAEKSNLSVTS